MLFNPWKFSYTLRPPSKYVAKYFSGNDFLNFCNARRDDSSYTGLRDINLLPPPSVYALRKIRQNTKETRPSKLIPMLLSLPTLGQESTAPEPKRDRLRERYSQRGHHPMKFLHRENTDTGWPRKLRHCQNAKFHLTDKRTNIHNGHIRLSVRWSFTQFINKLR